MGKGIGIAALVIILISFVVPIVGTFVAYFALIIATVSALAGEKVFSIATAVIAGVKMFFLSPLLMGMMYASDGVPGALLLTSALTAAPIACVIFRPAIAGLLRNIGIRLPKSEETS